MSAHGIAHWTWILDEYLANPRQVRELAVEMAFLAMETLGQDTSQWDSIRPRVSEKVAA